MSKHVCKQHISLTVASGHSMDDVIFVGWAPWWSDPGGYWSRVKRSWSETPYTFTASVWESQVCAQTHLTPGNAPGDLAWCFTQEHALSLKSASKVWTGRTHARAWLDLKHLPPQTQSTLSPPILHRWRRAAGVWIDLMSQRRPMLLFSRSVQCRCVQVNAALPQLEISGAAHCCFVCAQSLKKITSAESIERYSTGEDCYCCCNDWNRKVFFSLVYHSFHEPLSPFRLMVRSCILNSPQQILIYPLILVLNS